MTVVLHRRSVRERGKRLTVRIEEEMEVEESQGEVGSCRALSVSANSSALSNSMHVLMKHCWPAAHCQRHCYIDDWSIEGPCAFVRIQPSALPRPLPPLPSPLLILLPATTLFLPRNLSRREPTRTVPTSPSRAASRFWRGSKTTCKKSTASRCLRRQSSFKRAFDH